MYVCMYPLYAGVVGRYKDAGFGRVHERPHSLVDRNCRRLQTDQPSTHGLLFAAPSAFLLRLRLGFG